MSYEKFIQSRTIARKSTIADTPVFPTFTLDSFIEFETDGYLIGVNWMTAHSNSEAVKSVDLTLPFGFLLAKVSGNALNIPDGLSVTNFSGAQILATHLDYPSDDGAKGTNADSRQTNLAYDANSKRIVLKSGDRLGVYICSNALLGHICNYAYTLTAYFVRS